MFQTANQSITSKHHYRLIESHLQWSMNNSHEACLTISFLNVRSSSSSLGCVCLIYHMNHMVVSENRGTPNHASIWTILDHNLVLKPGFWGTPAIPILGNSQVDATFLVMLWGWSCMNESFTGVSWHSSYPRFSRPKYMVLSLNTP